MNNYQLKYYKYKNKYLNLLNSQDLLNGGGANSRHIVYYSEMDNQNYASVAVIPIFNDCVILFTSSRNNVLYEAGGRIDSDSILDNNLVLERNASRELYEESRKTIYISPDILRKLRLRDYAITTTSRYKYNGKNAKLKAYFCRINNLDLDSYYRNKETINKKPGFNVYKETNDIVLIPISNIKNTTKINNSYYINDINNNKKEISYQALMILNDGFSLIKSPYDIGNGENIIDINNNDKIETFVYK